MLGENYVRWKLWAAKTMGAAVASVLLVTSYGFNNKEKQISDNSMNSK